MGLEAILKKAWGSFKGVGSKIAHAPTTMYDYGSNFGRSFYDGLVSGTDLLSTAIDDPHNTTTWHQQSIGSYYNKCLIDRYKDEKQSTVTTVAGAACGSAVPIALYSVGILYFGFAPFLLVAGGLYVAQKIYFGIFGEDSGEKKDDEGHEGHEHHPDPQPGHHQPVPPAQHPAA